MNTVRILMAVVAAFGCLTINDSLSLVFAAQAQQAGQGVAAEPSSALKNAVRLHDEAVKGKRGVSKEANAILKKIVLKYPENAVVTAYYGSTYTLMARDAKSVVNKVRYSNRGIRYLDAALELAPEDFVVRFIRAGVNSSLPAMFKRTEKATEDMLALDKLYQSRPIKSWAAMMTGIYEKLLARAPDKGPWHERLEQARAASRE